MIIFRYVSEETVKKVDWKQRRKLSWYPCLHGGVYPEFYCGNKKNRFHEIMKIRNSMSQNLNESIEIIMATKAGDL